MEALACGCLVLGPPQQNVTKYQQKTLKSQRAEKLNFSNRDRAWCVPVFDDPSGWGPPTDTKYTGASRTMHANRAGRAPKSRRIQPPVEPIRRLTSPREARRAQLRTHAGRAARPFSTIHPDGRPRQTPNTQGPAGQSRQSGGPRAEISSKSAIRGAHSTFDVSEGGPESPTSNSCRARCAPVFDDPSGWEAPPDAKYTRASRTVTPIGRAARRNLVEISHPWSPFDV